MSSALSVTAGTRRAVDTARLGRLLRDICGPSHVKTDADALAPYGHDETHGLTPIPPDAVVLPGNTREVAEVMRACASLELPVVPRGAGTGRSGGCVPAHGGVVVALTRMAAVNEIDPSDGVAVVEPGVILGAFQQRVEAEGWFYPPDPASLADCTLGGNVAENAGGPRAVKYGVTRDYLLGLEAVLPTGETVRMGRRSQKGVAGYDLAGLMCGSEGTLAILTSLTLRIIPRPPVVQTGVMAFASAQDAARTVTAVLARGIRPRTLEYLDALTLDAVRPLGGYAFPADARAALIIEADGVSEDAVWEELRRAAEVATAHGAQEVVLAQDEAQRRRIWDTRHKLSAATRQLTGHKVSEDVVVPRGRVPEMVARLAATGERHGLRVGAFGHAGDGNLHVQVIFNDPVAQKAQVEACLREVTVEALQLGGSVSGEHGVGLAKRALLELEQGPEVIALQKRIKAAFDPRGILNPGKVFP
ncbi:MAG: FAD-binding protein [Deltaproteobacteria bacterium]|nr:FAD-binding protein [Deltaproteobacteria bacterium]